MVQCKAFNTQLPSFKVT